MNQNTKAKFTDDYDLEDELEHLEYKNIEVGSKSDLEYGHKERPIKTTKLCSKKLGLSRAELFKQDNQSDRKDHIGIKNHLYSRRVESSK